MRCARGPASQHTCIDCGQPAYDWSQTHGTTGLDLDADYQPRCRRDHMIYDRTLRLGEDCQWAKLTRDQVLELRELHATGDWSRIALADRLDVDPSTIGKIINYRTWAWLS